MLSLEKLLARNLPCSRKEARRLMGDDRVELPGGLSPDTLPLRISIAGRVLELHDSFHLMLNKPAGCVTALSDAKHDTAAAQLHGAPLLAELRPVGRLDLDTTGLLTHPRTAIPRTYHAALARPFGPPPANLVLRDGHRPVILDLRTLPDSEVHSSLLRPAGASDFASITIAGGAYHEVRRIFAALGSHVTALCRVSFGTLILPPSLPPGSWRQITKANVEQVAETP